MRGYEHVDVQLPDGSIENRKTALCCQAVCFFSITGVNAFLDQCNITLPPHMLTDLVEDRMIFVLARWFSPHPSAFERDASCLPICPGPLRLNQCLWKFAKSRRYRKCMCNDNGTQNRNFEDQNHIFGHTAQQRIKRFKNEKKAYYDILSPNAIKKSAHMTPEFIGNTLDISDTWIQTVTLI